MTNQTWLWNATNWRLANPSNRPPARAGHAMAYDPARKVIVMFGGIDLSVTPTKLLGDTWEWNGTTWRRVSTVGPAPRHSHAMAYDAKGILLFGGDKKAPPLQDTWRWNGSAWTRLSPATSPGSRSAHAMVWDARSSEVVLFGGATQNSARPAWGDTWLWNGAKWTLSSATGPCPRWSPGMAYDRFAKRVVLYGGLGAAQFGDSWQWRNGKWHGVCGACRVPRGSCRPRSRTAHAAAWDPVRRCVVVHGGIGGSLFADTWGLFVPAVHSTSGHGTGCTGPRGTPELRCTSLPVLGHSAVIEVARLPTRSLVLFFLGGHQRSWACFPRGCCLHVLPTILPPPVWATLGKATIKIPIPDVVGLQGATIFDQAAIFYGFAAGLKLMTSNAGRLTLGLKP